MGVVSTIPDRCKRCYACIRNCPVKAIRVRERQAEVMEQRCIGCGTCVRVCGQRAKKIESGIETLKRFFGNGEKVIAAVAPSHPAFFYPASPGQGAAALKKLGFDSVMEVAFGAEMISLEYKKYLSAHPDRPLITTPCPSIFMYIKKYQPSLIPLLAPIVSPMVALGRAVKKNISPEARVVFIGPCIAKKLERESRLVRKTIALVLTFEEITQMFEEKGVMPLKMKGMDFDGPKPAMARSFPLSGGLLKTVALSTDILEKEIVVIEGKDRVLPLLRDIEKGLVNAKFYDLLLCEGCINGPVLNNPLGLIARKNVVVDFVNEGLKKSRGNGELKKFFSINLRRYFKPDPQGFIEPSDEMIESVLKRIRIRQRDQELNCGACGYDSCREKAVAVCNGFAEIEMCLPFIITQLEESYREIEASHKQLQESYRELDKSHSELKNLHRELEETHTHLIQAEKLASMGKLAASVAHEINNPLAGILTYIKLIRKRIGKAPQDLIPGLEVYDRYLQTMEKETDRCGRIVKNLLDFARQTEPSRAYACLNDIVGDVMNLLSHQIKISSVEVILDLNSSRQVMIDSAQMKQVFMNLMMNSIQALDADRRIFIRTRDGEKSVSFEVEDKGIGIPPDSLSRVFEPFFTTKDKGTGLGLSVAHGIITKHGGSIDIKSSVGEGTKVRVELPL
ncbi:MAG: 4Fe-4S binding protein [Deltaproteobacteria bacterium]|nr:4Fe-4S binding protein [Deltaproteobacteria bacterium]